MFFSSYFVQLLQLYVSSDLTQTVWPLNFTAYSIFEYVRLARGGTASILTPHKLDVMHPESTHTLLCNSQQDALC